MKGITFIDKLKYFISYKLDVSKHQNPYKRVIINDKLEDYKKNSVIMNSIYSENVNQPQAVWEIRKTWDSYKVPL